MPVTPSLRIRQGASRAPAPKYVAQATSDGGTTYWPLATRPPASRVHLVWIAGARGKPALNADIQNAAEAVRMIADPDFEVLGTNGVTASTSFNAEGGITLTTAGASGDQVILAPHLDANQSAWAQWTWGTDRSVVWECTLRTGAAITATKIWAGLKLTNTPTVATDNDQVYVRYEAGVASGVWQVISSIANVDTTTSSSITVAVSTVYRIIITISASRVARVYILVGDADPATAAPIYTTAALTDATDLIPYIGIEAAAAAAKSMTVYGAEIGRATA